MIDHPLWAVRCHPIVAHGRGVEMHPQRRLDHRGMFERQSGEAVGPDEVPAFCGKFREDIFDHDDLELWVLFGDKAGRFVDEAGVLVVPVVQGYVAESRSLELAEDILQEAHECGGPQRNGAGKMLATTASRSTAIAERYEGADDQVADETGLSDDPFRQHPVGAHRQMAAVLLCGADRNDDRGVGASRLRYLLPGHAPVQRSDRCCHVNSFSASTAFAISGSDVTGSRRCEDHFLDPAHAARARQMSTTSAMRYWRSWVASAIPVNPMTTSGGSGHRGILYGRGSFGILRRLHNAAIPMQKYTAAITVPAKMIRKFSAEVKISTPAGTASSMTPAPGARNLLIEPRIRFTAAGHTPSRPVV